MLDMLARLCCFDCAVCLLAVLAVLAVAVVVVLVVVVCSCISHSLSGAVCSIAVTACTAAHFNCSSAVESSVLQQQCGKTQVMHKALAVVSNQHSCDITDYRCCSSSNSYTSFSIDKLITVHCYCKQCAAS
jgi:hypothetical protein